MTAEPIPVRRPQRVLLGVLMLVPLLATGETVDTSGWECNFCPFEDGQIESEVEAGSLHADGATAKSGEFDGISEDGWYFVVDGVTGARQEGGSYWRVTAQDLGLDNGAVLATAGREGRWRVDLGYAGSPRNVYDTTVTPFLPGSPASQSLPAGWVRAGNTQFMSALESSLRNYDLGTKRDRWLLNGETGGSSGWKTELRYSHETRDGRRLVGSGFVTTASQLAGPVNFVTDQIDWSARYATARGTLGVSYLGSFFSNKHVSLSWDNPFTAIAPGADVGRTALAPDNRYNQLAFNLAYELGPAWRATLNAAVGRAEQDEGFLPYTTNPLIATAPLPRASLDGSVDVRQVNLQLAGNLGAQVTWLEGLRGRLNYRYYERDNGTPQAEYVYVEGDSFPAGAATNLPYGFRRQKLSVTGDYDLARLFWPGSGHSLQLSGGWDREEWDRSFQEVDESIEDSGWVRLRASPLTWLTLDARYGAANRDTDPYVTGQPGSAPQNPLMRKYHLADRERDFWELAAHLLLPRDFSLSLGGFERRDDYVNSTLGLTRSRETGGTADLSWTISEKTSAYAFYGRQKVSYRQNGSQTFGASDWQANGEDEFDTASAGFRLTGLGDRWNIQFDYFYLDGQGDIEMRSGSLAAFPPLRTRSHGPSLEIEYQATAALQVIASFRYEHYDARDWALDGVQPDTVPSLLASGADAYNHDANVAGISFRYRFGGTDSAAADREE